MRRARRLTTVRLARCAVAHSTSFDHTSENTQSTVLGIQGSVSGLVRKRGQVDAIGETFLSLSPDGQ
eukprot:4834310-Pyramimonas_sp.AAC.1